ncbi:hypothetical protein Taro_038320 [Colocasia esculenta]|uniref:60S ribosomal protein L10a n=1 Tax=Colocasia esculenta TaxID=4460 RepID=A0A843W6D3_COLES|nr:hypothetical protein [Colocasia esculenta]
MGNCLPSDLNRKRSAVDGGVPLPIQTAFKLPAPLPSWPSGGETLDLGGLEICQVSTFAKAWTALEGGADGLGATFFHPSPLPAGFSSLGSYAQPNNRPLFGWVLAGRDAGGGGALRLCPPVDYILLWTSANSKVNREGDGYFWFPTPPEGYRAVGLLVTSSPEKPPLDAIRCVRADLTDQGENDESVWSDGNGFEVHSLRPSVRGSGAAGVRVGTCAAGAGASAVACLKNMSVSQASAVANGAPIETLVQAYSPWFWFHPKDPYLPSSVGWFFGNGALLYKKGDPNPARIDPSGSNLPQGGSNDGEYWLDLPGGGDRDRVMKGDLSTVEVYLHVKPAVLGGTFTDIAFWVFHPFNGPARAKLGPFNISLGRIGEHVSDWEHVTLRVSNLNGELQRVFFAQHSGGVWVEAPQLEFRPGTNKPVVYSSLHGHASYPKPGLVLQGDAKLGVGIRNDTEGGGPGMDAGARYKLVAVDGEAEVVEPPWLNYRREWGPKVEYDVGKEIGRATRLLPRRLRRALEKIVRSLPAELLGEEGPTGPKDKGSCKLQSDVLREAISQLTTDSKEKKRKFTETIELQIGLKNYDPQKDKRFSGSVKLPHIPRPKMKVCMLGDAQHVEEAEKIGLDYMDVEGLKKMNKNKKLVKKLAKKHHAFLASEAIIKQIPRLLGPGLNKAGKVGKFPTLVSHQESLESKVNETKAMVKFQLKKVLCMGVAVGNCQMEEKQIFQNVQLSVNFLVSLLKKNWQNVGKVFVPEEHYGETNSCVLKLQEAASFCPATEADAFLFHHCFA